MQTMRSPRCSGALARLRDVFGVESPVTVDNVINLMFAGFDTTSSTITYMLSQLAQHPHVLEKVSGFVFCCLLRCCSDAFYDTST
jgi:muramoyltetrapeptide carboxypeptidase LdcA involved in peptidoglycan recycling